MADASSQPSREAELRQAWSNALVWVLQSVQRALETPLLVRRSKVRPDDPALDRLSSAIAVIERAKLTIKIAFRVTGIDRHLQQTAETLRTLVTSPELHPFLDVKVHLTPPELNVPFSYKSLDGTNVRATLRGLVSRIEEELGIGTAKFNNDEQDLDALRAILPPQKIAPLQFEFRQGRLALARIRSEADTDTKEIVTAARQELLSQGGRIIGELEKSNCDQRVVASIRYLQEQLATDANIVRLGLSNITCDAMVRQFKPELPDAVFAMLQGHIRSVEMFAAQFPDWAKFVENAGAARIAESDIDDIDRAASGIIEELANAPELADPEVPRSIAYLREMVRSPGTSGKRASFAILRSLENLVSRVYLHTIELLEQTASKTVKKLSGALATAAVGTLLVMAMNAAGAVSPLTNKVPEMQWMRTATELLQRQLQYLR